MNGVSHAIVGASLSLLAIDHLGVTGLSQAIPAMGVGVVGALSPDLDSRQSLLKGMVRPNGRLLTSHLFRKGSLAGAVISIPERIVRRGIWILLSAISTLFRHRGFLHSLIFLAQMSAVFILLSSKFQRGSLFLAIFLIGYGSHIAADMTTKRGVKLLHPFYKSRYYLLPPKLRCSVSRPVSIQERMVVLAICMCVLVAMRLG